ncbi:universal stress protein [Streptomyces mirabilis]|uniref:universal stress protein n=1 Tax=Streptomyces mirabilis TaxID=68239 RepID=UPI0036DE8D97
MREVPRGRRDRDRHRGARAGELIHASAGAALLVVGRRVRQTRLGTHLGSVAHAVLHHAPCPVAVVPHG